jgi:acetylglutamate kinase
MLASQWDRESAALVVVHGGGDEVSALQASLGGAATFAAGDVTTARHRCSQAFPEARTSALFVAVIRNRRDRLSGEDAGLIAAAPPDIERLLCRKPCRINVALQRHLLAGGYLPVISPVSRDATGTLGSALTVNGDDAAAATPLAPRAPARCGRGWRNVDAGIDVSPPGRRAGDDR